MFTNRKSPILRVGIIDPDGMLFASRMEDLKAKTSSTINTNEIVEERKLSFFSFGGVSSLRSIGKANSRRFSCQSVEYFCFAFSQYAENMRVETVDLDRRIIELRRYLISLADAYPLCGVKAGTETEDMDAEEIRVLHLVSSEILPCTVKIGGPEARTDIRICAKEEVEGICGPMIESAYALKNFINTLKSMLTPVSFKKIQKSINLETITGYRNIMEIMDSRFFEELDQVTAARSDLSASMELIPDDEEVMKVTKNIVKLSKERGKLTSVGGTITKANFRKIAEEILPNKINSRHVAVLARESLEKDPEEVAEAMLSFEIELYDLLGELKPEKSFYYKNRIETNRERIGSRKVLYSIR